MNWYFYSFCVFQGGKATYIGDGTITVEGVCYESLLSDVRQGIKRHHSTKGFEFDVNEIKLLSLSKLDG